jgi:hypothetical protein
MKESLKRTAIQHKRNKRVESTQLADLQAQLADPGLINTDVKHFQARSYSSLRGCANLSSCIMDSVIETKQWKRSIRSK